MPPPLWALLILSGLLHGHTLLHAVKGVDPSVQHRPGSPPSVHHVITVPALSSIADEDGVCEVRLFAVTKRGELRRLRIDGVEQVLDWSWTYDYLVDEGKRRVVQLEFIHPVTREVEPRPVSFRCKSRRMRFIQAAPALPPVGLRE